MAKKIRHTNLSLHAGVYELQPGAVHVAKGDGDAAARNSIGHGVNLSETQMDDSCAFIFIFHSTARQAVRKYS